MLANVSSSAPEAAVAPETTTTALPLPSSQSNASADEHDGTADTEGRLPSSATPNDEDSKVPEVEVVGEISYEDVGDVSKGPPGGTERTALGTASANVWSTGTGTGTGYMRGTNETTAIGWNSTSSATPSYDTTTLVTTTPPPSDTVDSDQFPPEGSISQSCLELEPGEVETTFIFTWTSTVTWTEDPYLYTPPYPDEDVQTPKYCKDIPPVDTTSYPPIKPNYDGWSTICETYGISTSCSRSLLFHPLSIGSISWLVDTDAAKKAGPTTTEDEPAMATPFMAPPEKSTVYMTIKNPSVAFSPTPPPKYGKTSVPANTRSRVGGNPPAQSVKLPDSDKGAVQANQDGQGQNPGFTITAGPTGVVINGQTFTNLPPQGTTKITVDGQVFTVNPSQIIQGGGETIQRPNPGGGRYVPNPTSTNVGGLGVQVTGSVVVLGGYTYTIGNAPDTEIVQGQTVVIAPTGVSFKNSGKTISFKAVTPEQTEVVVAGGELVTAIGPSVVVIHSTTITYGPGISPRTEVVDDDTIVIGPSGVVVHGTTIGGEKLKGTKYAVVGGATITQVGPSKVVINSVTYTVGPGTGKTTTVIGGETITIGPDGVSVSSLTLHYPFGPTIVTTILPEATADSPAPAQTGDDEDDMGVVPRPGWALAFMSLCIAIGAMALDFTI